MDGKSPPQAPQPHPYPTVSLYLLEPLLKHLWSVQVACFRVTPSYVRVSTKKPSNSPWLIGLKLENSVPLAKFFKILGVTKNKCQDVKKMASTVVSTHPNLRAQGVRLNICCSLGWLYSFQNGLTCLSIQNGC